jgi:hypothetical protein
LVEQCTEFDVDLQANTVKCVRGGFAINTDAVDVESQSRYISERMAWGPIVSLKKDFPNGIE